MLPYCIGDMESYTSFNIWRIADLKRMPFWDCFLKIVLLLWQHGQKQQKKKRSKNYNNSHCLDYVRRISLSDNSQQTANKLKLSNRWKLFFSLSVLISFERHLKPRRAAHQCLNQAHLRTYTVWQFRKTQLIINKWLVELSSCSQTTVIFDKTIIVLQVDCIHH